MKVCIVCGKRFNSLEWTCPVCGYSPKLLEGYLSFAPALAEESEGFDVQFFPKLAALEAQHFWFRSRNRLIIWALQHYFPQTKNLLEIGCGTGFVLSGIEQAFSHLEHLELYGSEIFTAGLRFASQRLSRATLFQMDARHIPFEAEFDVIGAFDVLEHIQEDKTVLAQMYQAVPKGGGIILTVPQHPWLWSRIDDYSHHVRRYTAKELKKKVEQAGFQIMRITSFVSFLLPLMMISRLRGRKSNLENDTSELNMNRLVNTLLEKVLDGEQFLIRQGLSLPVGGSLLLVARKL